jgi:DNA-binding MarR family transcriptional regulator
MNGANFEHCELLAMLMGHEKGKHSPRVRGKGSEMAPAITESLQVEDEVEMHEKLLQEASQSFRVLQRLMKHVKHQLAADLPREQARMGEGQYRAMHFLCDEGRLTAGELAGRANVAEPTMSRIVKSLESSGFVERHTDPGNRRLVWVELTPKGRAMHEEMVQHFGRGIARVLRPLNNAQLRDIVNALHHLDGLIGVEPEGSGESV